MAKKKAATQTAEEAAPEATPAEETPSETPPAEVTTEATPEGEPQSVDDEQTMEAFLEDEGDDLDADAPAKAKLPEETPSEGPEPKEAVPEEAKPAETPPEAAPEPSPAEAKPEEIPPTPVPAEAKPEPAPPTVPPAAPVEKPPETPPAAAPPAVDMEQIRKTYRENRDTLQKQVATEVYNFSEEQVQQFDAGDLGVVSNLAARVYMDAVTGSVAHMMTFLPRMVEQVLAGRDTNQANETRFYTANPNLDKTQHGETVSKFGMAYRTLFPNASSEDFIRDVGAQVMVAMQIQPGSVALPSAEPTVPKVPAFQPANAGGGGGAAPSPTNVFEALSDAMDPTEDLNVD